MTGAANAGLGRFVSRHVGVLLARNTVVSCLVFAFDLGLLWLLVQAGGMDTLLAAGVATWTMSGANPAMSRRIDPGSPSARRNSLRTGSGIDGTGTSVPAGSKAGVAVTGE